MRDLLQAAIDRPDGRCGPLVMALTWAAREWLELQPSDVQKQAECEFAGAVLVPVYLGTVGPDGRPLRADQWIETLEKRS